MDMDAPRQNQDSKPDNPTPLLSSETLGLIAAVGLLVLMATRQWQPAAAVVAGLVVLVIGIGRGWWRIVGRWLVAIGRELWRRMRLAFARRQQVESEERYGLYDVVIGVDPNSQEEVVVNLEELGHVGLWGMTRYGKTTWLHAFIHQLIQRHRQHELKLAISDPKTVDYPFYGRLTHLLCPIARTAEETEQMVDRLIDEMNSRAALFGVYGSKRRCNNLQRYHELSGRRLPRIVAVFDEMADVVVPGSRLEDKLIRLAKLGLAYGIHLICATQRPSAGVMTGEIRSQLATKMSTYMSSSREYGVVGLIPKEMYEAMEPIPGRFMIFTPVLGRWCFTQGLRISDRELEREAMRLSGRARVWPVQDGDRTADHNPHTGTQEEKETEYLNWMNSLDRKPTAPEFMQRWGCSKPTALKYIRQLWPLSRLGRTERG